jgi:signal transduction histidine kinase
MDTASKTLERPNLELQAVELEALVADRTRELATTVAELEAFTYSVAHDLRAPLRAIHSFSSALLEDHLHRFDGEALDYLHRIAGASERMSQLIDDLLKLSKIGRGEVERKPVDVSAMVATIAMRNAERQPLRRVQLDVEADIVANGDARLLLIAFENLLDNAWKFTRYRDPAIVRVYIAEQSGVRRICIADNGAGFDTRYRHKLFAPFQRLHRADEFEGTGIGLVIVARIVARHGGEATIESAVDQGTTVSLLLPIAD